MKRFMVIATGIALLLTMIPAVSLASDTQTGQVGCLIWAGDYGYLGAKSAHWIWYLDKGGLVVKCLGSLPEGQTPPDTTVKVGFAEMGSYPWGGNPCGAPAWTDDWSTSIYPDGNVRLVAKWDCPSSSPYP
ncbi:MAG TPA: hypothetical protein VLA49_03045 [Anaerolineales bacterium]|nr:hypothetical protein [Anaerolineales bacterium]